MCGATIVVQTNQYSYELKLQYHLSAVLTQVRIAFCSHEARAHIFIQNKLTLTVKSIVHINTAINKTRTLHTFFKRTASRFRSLYDTYLVARVAIKLSARRLSCQFSCVGQVEHFIIRVSAQCELWQAGSALLYSASRIIRRSVVIR